MTSERVLLLKTIVPFTHLTRVFLLFPRNACARWILIVARQLRLDALLLVDEPLLRTRRRGGSLDRFPPSFLLSGR